MIAGIFSLRCLTNSVASPISRAFNRVEGRGGSLLSDRAPHRIQPGLHQFLAVEGRFAGQDFIKQYTQAVDVAARINIQPTHLCLLGAHIRWRAHELVESGEDGFVGQSLFDGFGYAEINHLGHGHAVMQCHQDIGRFDISMNDSLLMRVLDGMADIDEEVEPLSRGEPF